jgi:hypothetical protein
MQKYEKVVKMPKKICFFGHLLLSLRHERAHQLDRLGEGTGGNYRHFLPSSTVAGMVLLPVFTVCHYCDILLPIRLPKERLRQ